MAYDRSMRRKATATGAMGTGRKLPVLAAVLLAPAAATPSQAAAPIFKTDEAPVQAAREPPRVLAERLVEPPVADKAVDRIVRDVEKKNPGAKVVRQEVKEEKGRRVLVLRMLSDKGKVWMVRVDMDSGKEL